MLMIFSCASLPNMCVCFGEVSVKIFCLFFIQVVHSLTVGLKSSLYILDNSPSPGMFFANIFSRSVARLLILFTFSFTEQKI